MTPLAAPDADTLLAFWFGEGAEPGTLAAREAWFRKDAAFDGEIRARFGALVEQALAGGLVDWAETPRAALARVLLLDQFTRNAFRDTPRAFAGDALALAAAQSMVARGHDRALRPLARVFVYLPYEHAEDLGVQRESLALFAALAAEDAALAGYEDYARRHAVVIERFGRFPHRNAVLGRASSAEELAFLAQPGSRF